MVARYYAAARERGAYRVRFLADNATIDDQVVAIAESKMVRSIVSRGTRTLQMRICEMDGSACDFVNSIHLAVLQLIPLRQGGNSSAQ